MSEKEENTPKKTLKLSKKRTLNKVIDAGQIKQSFSHGRSKTVAVEVKRKRIIEGKSGAKTTKPEPKNNPKPNRTEENKEERKETNSPRPHGLTDKEWTTRVQVLKQAKKENEEKARLAEENKEQERLEKEEQEATQPKIKGNESSVIHKKQEKKTKQSAKLEDSTSPEDEIESVIAAQASLVAQEKETKASVSPASEKAKKTKVAEESSKKLSGKKLSLSHRTEPRRRSEKLTTRQALQDKDEERMRSLASIKRSREKQRLQAKQEDLMQQHPKKIVRAIQVPETIGVQELSNRMAVRTADVIKKLMDMGVIATINQIIDADTAELIAIEFGHKVNRVSESDVEEVLRVKKDAVISLKHRPPVVTVMGHVDHGKTSLLDTIRKSDIAANESGGITQHIGAYQVSMDKGQKITFIDTPGHAAFTEMRARGASATDIVVLVVAADDGIKEQTIEAINHAKAAKVPIIIAINKIDKPEADPKRVKNELLSHELVVEDMGGDILCVEVSAKEKLNIDKLEEIILLQADLMDLKANPNRMAEGIIVEAKLERGRGAVATVLVQLGTICIGDIFVAGTEWGRVRALIDDRGNRIEEAGPSIPVEILGFNGTPAAGDSFIAVKNETNAREIAEFRHRKLKEARIAIHKRSTMEDFLSQSSSEKKELAVIVKSDVHGSAEAITSSLNKLSTDEVSVKVLHTGVGGIKESDITLAKASQGIVIGFNVRANIQARELAQDEGIEIRYYSIIYDVIEDIKAALTGLLSPAKKERFLGNAEIREVFSVSKVGKIAGCLVTKGIVKLRSKIRLFRNDIIVHEGSLKTLNRFKDEVREVKEGYECGMAFENYHDIKVGDVIECFNIEEVARTL